MKIELSILMYDSLTYLEIVCIFRRRKRMPVVVGKMK